MQALQAVTTPHADLAARLSLIEAPQRKAEGASADDGRVSDGEGNGDEQDSQDAYGDEAYDDFDAGSEAYDQVQSNTDTTLARRVGFQPGSRNSEQPRSDRDSTAQKRIKERKKTGYAHGQNEFDYGGTPLSADEAGTLLEDQLFQDAHSPRNDGGDHSSADGRCAACSSAGSAGLLWLRLRCHAAIFDIKRAQRWSTFRMHIDVSSCSIAFRNVQTHSSVILRPRHAVRAVGDSASRPGPQPLRSH